MHTHCCCLPLRLTPTCPRGEERLFHTASQGHGPCVACNPLRPSMPARAKRPVRVASLERVLSYGTHVLFYPAPGGSLGPLSLRMHANLIVRIHGLRRPHALRGPHCADAAARNMWVKITTMSLNIAGTPTLNISRETLNLTGRVCRCCALSSRLRQKLPRGWPGLGQV